MSFNIYTRLGVPSSNTRFDANRKFVTSLFLSPLALAGMRLLIAGYTMVTLVVILAWKAEVTHDSQSFLSYFTYLTYTGICAYYFASGTQTLAYALRLRRSDPARSSPEYPLQSWPRVFQALHVVLQASITSFPYIVTVVFWVLLADSTTLSGSFSAWSNLSVHAFNVIFATFEVLATNSAPAPWLALPVCELFLVGYLGVAYITHATQGIYTYSFLDPKKQGPLLAAYIIGIAFAECVVFAAVRGLVVLRQRWAVRTRRLVLDSAASDTDESVRESAEKTNRGSDDDWVQVESPVTREAGTSGSVGYLREV